MSLMMVSPKENRVDAILGKNDASQGHLVQNGKCTVQPLLTPSFETFETQHRSFEKFVIQRWIFLKENSNAPTWKQKFLESKFLIEKDIEDSGNSCMKRAELAEWLLIKALQKIKSVENIQLISDVVFKDGFEKTTTGNVFHTESVSNIEALHLKLSKHQCDIEKNLTREDAIAIKDQLMQDEIIELTENEKLIKDEKRFPEGKTSLKSAVFIMIQNKLKLGSYQCFIKSLETINNKKRRRRPPITQLIRKLEGESMTDSTNSGRHTIQMDTLHSEFHDKNIEGKEDFILTMEATNEEGNEVLEAYIPTLTNPEMAETILVKNLPVESIQISTGSLVIHFRLMERNMQDFLKDCLRSGKISTVVKMLFSETSIKDIIPVGKLQLKVKIEVNKDTCLPESLPEHSSTINNFVMDNRSFIQEEMDTDFLEEELKKIGKSISYKSCNGRKEKADQILDFIIANELAERFVSVIKTNKEDRFDYVLKRIETYEQVYGIDASYLRKNVLTQFSEIVKVIDIDDVREVLLERNTIEEHSLNDIDDRFPNNRDIGMATLLLKILKSGDAAVRAFVDALFIMRSSFAEKMLRCKSELVVIEEDSKVAICASSMDDNLLFDGSFNVIIEKMGSDIPNTIQHCKVLPTHNTDMFTNQTDTLALTDDMKIEIIRRLEADCETLHQFDDGDQSEININEQNVSSVESSTLESVESPHRLMKSNAAVYQLKENIHTYSPYDSAYSTDRNIHERDLSSVESSTFDSMRSPYQFIQSNDAIVEQRENMYTNSPNDSAYSTDMNIHERGLSSVESSTYQFIQSNDATVEQRENIYTCSPYDSAHSTDRNIQLRSFSLVESSTFDSELSCYQFRQRHDALVKTMKQMRIQKENISEFKISCQGNWIYLKSITELSMVPMFAKKGLANEDDLRCLNNATRSQKADLLIVRVLQSIQSNTDIRNFKEILGRHVCENLIFSPVKYYRIKDTDNIRNLNRLNLNRKLLIRKLMTIDIEEIKDRLMQDYIIGIDENDMIIKHPGFCERRNAIFSKYFVDEHIIRKSFLGSYQCLVEYLEETTRNRSTRLRQLCESLKSDDSKQSDTAVKEPKVFMKVLQTSYSENETEGSTADKDIEMKLKFKTEDEDTKKVYNVVKIKAKTNNGTTGTYFGGCIDRTEFGSVVFHMVALEKEMIQNILNLFRKQQFSNVVKMLLNDIQIRRCLSSGKHELEVTCYVKEKKDSFVQGTCCKVHKLNPIADNKRYLEEEMDTLVVLKEFENLGVYIGIDVQDGDRKFRARNIMKKALSDDIIANTLHKILSESEMTNVKNRLLQYEMIYGSDSSQVQKNIYTHFKVITSEVFLDDIRLIFTERNIFEDELFETEEQTGADNVVAMANVLTEIIKRTDAMLTLVDVLFQIQLDTLGTKLMMIELFDDDKMKTKMKESECTNKHTKKYSDKNHLLTGRFEVCIRRARRTTKKRSSAKKCSKTKAVKRRYNQLDNVQQAATCTNDVQERGIFCKKNKLSILTELPDETHFNNQQPGTGDKYGMFAANVSNCSPSTQITNKASFYQQSDASPGQHISPTRTAYAAVSGYSTHFKPDDVASSYQQSDASPRQDLSPTSTQFDDSTPPETDDMASFYKQSNASPGQELSPTSTKSDDSTLQETDDMASFYQQNNASSGQDLSPTSTEFDHSCEIITTLEMALFNLPNNASPGQDLSPTSTKFDDSTPPETADVVSSYQQSDTSPRQDLSPTSTKSDDSTPLETDGGLTEMPLAEGVTLEVLKNTTIE